MLDFCHAALLGWLFVHGGCGGGGVYIVSEEWCIYVFLDLLGISNHLAEMRIKGSNREILLGV
jgi:hypothetical protein